MMKNKIGLNNFQFNKIIVKIRGIVKKKKWILIKKLIRDVQNLESKKCANEKQNTQNLKKKERFLDECNILKTYENDDLSKFLLLNTKSFNDVMANPNSSTIERAVIRLADNATIQTELNNFKKEFPNYEKEIPSLIKVLGILHRKQKVQSLKKKGTGSLQKFLDREAKTFRIMKELYNVDIDLKLLELMNSKKAKKSVTDKKEMKIYNLKKITPSPIRTKKDAPTTAKEETKTVPVIRKHLAVPDSISNIETESLSSNSKANDDEQSCSSESDHEDECSNYSDHSLDESSSNEYEPGSPLPEISSIFENVDTIDLEKKTTKNKRETKSKKKPIKNICDGMSVVRQIELRGEEVQLDETDMKSDEEIERSIGGNRSSLFLGRESSDIDQMPAPDEKGFNASNTGSRNSSAGTLNRRQRRLLERKGLKTEENPFHRPFGDLNRNSNKQEKQKQRHAPKKTSAFEKAPLHPSWTAKRKRDAVGSIQGFQGKKVRFEESSRDVDTNVVKTFVAPVKTLNKDSSDEVMHPSWAAKKKSDLSGSIQSFQGTKIKFDD